MSDALHEYRMPSQKTVHWRERDATLGLWLINVSHHRAPGIWSHLRPNIGNFPGINVKQIHLRPFLDRAVGGHLPDISTQFVFDRNRDDIWIVYPSGLSCVDSLLEIV